MKNKIICIIFIILLIMFNIVPVVGVSIKPIDVLKEDHMVLPEDLGENETQLIIISGPVAHMFSEIELISGPSQDIKKIDMLVNRLLLRFFLPFAIVYVKNITLNVRFKIDNFLNNSRFSYGSIFTNDNDTTIKIKDQRHELRIEEFTGYFLFNHARIFKIRGGFFRLGQFSFVGAYKNVTVL